VKVSEIANRLTGFSTPIFGVSWTPPQLDREVAQRVIRFLEDRGMLYQPYEAEVPEWVVESVLHTRRFLTECLTSGGIADELADSLRAMRAACQKFVYSVGAQGSREVGDAVEVVLPPGVDMFSGASSWPFNQALGELRGVFGVHIAQLAVRYGIDVPEPLSSILPLDAHLDED
jgi:hypothetical protein